MDLLKIQPDSIFRKRFMVLQAQNQIVGNAVFQNQTVPVPVLRDQPQSVVLSVADFVLCDVFPIHHDAAAVGRQLPAYDIYQFLLAVAIHACNPENLALSQLQID